MTDKPVLEPEEVEKVLDTDEPAGDAPGSGAADGPIVYSLRRPVAIAPEREAAARAVLERLVGELAEALSRELSAEIGIALGGFSQEQTAAAVAGLAQPAWLLSFAGVEAGGLTLGLEPACALSLVELALGGRGTSTDEGREPTPLEARVFDKLCNALAPVLARRCGLELAGGIFSAGRVPVSVAAPGQTVGVGILELTVGETKRAGLLLATPDLLAPDDEEEDERPPLEQMAARLSRARIAVRPVLPSGLMRLADLAALRPGSLLRFEATQHDPLELRVNGHTVFRGRITREDERTRFDVDWRRGRHDEDDTTTVGSGETAVATTGETT